MRERSVGRRNITAEKQWSLSPLRLLMGNDLRDILLTNEVCLSSFILSAAAEKRPRSKFRKRKVLNASLAWFCLTEKRGGIDPSSKKIVEEKVERGEEKSLRRLLKALGKDIHQRPCDSSLYLRYSPHICRILYLRPSRHLPSPPPPPLQQTKK